MKVAPRTISRSEHHRKIRTWVKQKKLLILPEAVKARYAYDLTALDGDKSFGDADFGKRGQVLAHALTHDPRMQSVYNTLMEYIPTNKQQVWKEVFECWMKAGLIPWNEWKAAQAEAKMLKDDLVPALKALSQGLEKMPILGEKGVMLPWLLDGDDITARITDLYQKIVDWKPEPNFFFMPQLNAGGRIQETKCMSKDRVRQCVSTLHTYYVDYETLPLRKAIATAVTVINDVVVPDEVNPDRRAVNSNMVKATIKEMKDSGYVGVRIQKAKLEYKDGKPTFTAKVKINNSQ